MNTEPFFEGMIAVGLPPFDPARRSPDGRIVGYVSREILAARDLTAEQRAFITRFVDRSDLFVNCYPVPSTGWARRQWLGLAEPGPLFAVQADGTTLFETLRTLHLQSEDEAGAVLAAMPLAERVPVLADLDLLMEDYWSSVVEQLLADAVPAIDHSFGPWALAMAEREVVRATAPPGPERCSLGRTRQLVVYVALVRAGIRIEPRFEMLLHIPGGKTPPEAARSWIEAVPADRREAALVDSVQRSAFGDARVKQALYLLALYPYPALVAFVLAHLSDAFHPPEVNRALKALGAKHHAIKAAVDAHKKATPKVPKLKLGTRSRLELPLGDMQRAQLECAAARYNGAVRTAEQILAGEDDAEEAFDPASIEVCRIDDAKKKPAYDAWLYMADSGTVFRAGTNEVVADVIQFGVECADKPLGLALRGVLHGKSRR